MNDTDTNTPRTGSSLPDTLGEVLAALKAAIAVEGDAAFRAAVARGRLEEARADERGVAIARGEAALTIAEMELAHARSELQRTTREAALVGCSRAGFDPEGGARWARAIATALAEFARS
jgi:Zn-dependent protease with chaperone function